MQPEVKGLRQNAHLEIYAHSFVLVGENDEIRVIWQEGKQSSEAQKRYRLIIESFEQGLLSKKIEEAKSPDIATLFEEKLSVLQKKALELIGASISAQVGRALVEVFMVQLAVKVICPEQDVRLHKGNSSRGNFSWVEGVSMRRLDDTYVGPSLRNYELLRMNRYGAFMTRTFAENYPYTPFYKAEISGAKQKWLALIEELEDGNLNADAALLYMLDILWKASEKFRKLATDTLDKLDVWFAKNVQLSIADAIHLITSHIERSEARARLLEIALHALLQALEELHVDLGGLLKPLMPMRTANLKHGNLGDIEIIVGKHVVEAWDAKYDSPYLSDALEELREKIRDYSVSDVIFGYVLFPAKKRYTEVERKLAEIADEFGLEVQILSFDEWVQQQVTRAQIEETSESNLAVAWLRAYVESLSMQRRNKAPIDEPTYDWLEILHEML